LQATIWYFTKSEAEEMERDHENSEKESKSAEEGIRKELKVNLGEVFQRENNKKGSPILQRDLSNHGFHFRDELSGSTEIIPLSPTLSDQVRRFLVIVEVLNQSLKTCLMATPLVYTGNNKWKMESHAKFRAEQRERLIFVELKLRTGDPDIPLFDLYEELLSIFCEITKVRIPAMPDFYINEDSHDRIPVVQASKIMCDRIATIRQASTEFKDKLTGTARAVVDWFTFCPVGRPQVYQSDNDWTLLNEKTLRRHYREQLLRLIPDPASPRGSASA